MPPLQRVKFLETAIPPVIEATKRLAASAVSTDPGSSSDDDDEEQDSSSSGEGNHAHGLDAKQQQQQPLPPPDEDDPPPRAVHEAATCAAETAVEFVGPLLDQACAEGALARDDAALEASAAARDPVKQSEKGERSARPGAGNAAASDLAVAAYTGFALSALEISAETSAGAAATAPAATAAVSPAEALAESNSSAFAVKLTNAEERLVGLVMSSPTVDLPLVLLHVYRLSFDNRVEARRKGGVGTAGSEHSASCGSRGGLAGLAELAITGSSPWTLQGVSSFAYLVRRKGGGGKTPMVAQQTLGIGSCGRGAAGVRRRDSCDASKAGCRAFRTILVLGKLAR